MSVLRFQVSIVLSLLLVMQVAVHAKPGFGRGLHINLARRSSKPVMPLERKFFVGDAFVERGHWVMLFCQSQDSQQCAAIRQELLKLKAEENSPVSNMRLAELDCSHDLEFCQQQGYAAYPATVVLQEFTKWTRQTFNRNDEGFQTLQAAWKQICSMPDLLETMLAKANAEVLALSFGLVLATMVVTWVMIEGFELWPKSSGKWE